MADYNNILWGIDPYAIEVLRGFINWGLIARHQYFFIREVEAIIVMSPKEAGEAFSSADQGRTWSKDLPELELRIATLRSCGRKDSIKLNHEFLGISDRLLVEAVAECERSQKCSFRGDYGISEPIRRLLENAFGDGKF